jgi:guanosine-3',5'-bis(diphosphate) 3'-pyrophosphohydrolase
MKVMDLGKVFEALLFAARAHREQRRKGSGDPYVNHLIEVAELLSRVAGVTDVDVLRAAVLHDVVEDTLVSPSDVERAFGARVRALVEAVTDDRYLPKDERRELQVEHMWSAEADVRMIKLADHCSNVAELPSDWSRQRQSDYLAWSERVARACSGTSPALDREYRDRVERARSRLA